MPEPAFGTESPALTMGVITVTIVPMAMVGADVVVTPKKELAANVSANTEVDSISSPSVVALAVGVLSMMVTWVDAGLAVTLIMLRTAE
jgi:hypothetical protein